MKFAQAELTFLFITVNRILTNFSAGIPISWQLWANAFVPHRSLPIFYRGKELAQHLIPNFICYGKIIVKLKGVDALTDEHRAQVINDLPAFEFQLGLLINIGVHPQLGRQHFCTD